MSEEQQTGLRELSAVSDSIRAITSSLELPEVLRLVLGRIETLTHTEALSFLLYDPAREELVFAATQTLREQVFAGARGEVPSGLGAWAARTGRSGRINDLSQAASYGIQPKDIDYVEKNLLAVPLRRRGDIIGAVELADRYGRDFVPEDERRLQKLADAFAESAACEELAQDLDALRRFFTEVAAQIPSEDATLILRDQEGRQQQLGGSRRLEAGVVDGLRISVDQGIAGWVARNQKPLRLDDVKSDPRYFSGMEKRTGFAPRTMLCVPVAMKGRLHGVIQCINKLDGSQFNDDELHLVQLLADHAAIAIENARLFREANLAARTDDLTGLSNTRHYNELLPEILERSDLVSLLVLDLDAFKAVVDGNGHLVGSRTIGQVGRHIGTVVRPGDVAARFGGDEFVVILPDTSTEDAIALAEELRKGIERMKVLEGTDVDISGVTASVGVATYPVHATSADGLFHVADSAMYRAKDVGKNTVVLADPTQPTL